MTMTSVIYSPDSEITKETHLTLTNELWSVFCMHFNPLHAKYFQGNKTCIYI